MQVRTSQDFMKPRERVLARLRSLERIEAALTAAGLQVERRAGWPEPSWHCSVAWNETTRAFDLALFEPEPGSSLHLGIESPLVEGVLALDLTDISGGCRVDSHVELSPRTLPARVAMQALALARGRIETRLQRFIGSIARG